MFQKKRQYIKATVNMHYILNPGGYPRDFFAKNIRIFSIKVENTAI